MSKILALAGATALLFVPLVAAHAQVMSPYGYNTNSYYPTTNSNSYYNDYNSSYYPTSSYNNSYYPSSNYYGSGYGYPSYYPSPTCTLSITAPANYGYGSSVGTVSWTTQNASSISLSNVGAVNTSGSVSVSMYPGQVFTLQMSGPGGSASCVNSYNPVPQQYGYPSYNNQPYYNTAPSYYPTTYPVTYNTYVAPVTNVNPFYHPITTIRNWWNNTVSRW